MLDIVDAIYKMVVSFQLSYYFFNLIWCISSITFSAQTLLYLLVEGLHCQTFNNCKKGTVIHHKGIKYISDGSVYFGIDPSIDPILMSNLLLHLIHSIYLKNFQLLSFFMAFIRLVRLWIYNQVFAQAGTKLYGRLVVANAAGLLSS